MTLSEIADELYRLAVAMEEIPLLTLHDRYAQAAAVVFVRAARAMKAAREPAPRPAPVPAVTPYSPPRRAYRKRVKKEGVSRG